ncbi:MAG: phosphoribosyltransferase [Epsilonproteobacteria bacterium]|nr:phosphoribosyltransferase [Campylobacterota bacterium]
MFKDRFEAGKALAEALKRYKNDPSTLVIALPRGGVPIGYEIAKELDLPLAIFFVKKIPSPYNVEAAIGAITEDGLEYLNLQAIKMLGIPRSYIDAQVKTILQKIKEKRKLYNTPLPQVEEKRVILVDDGVATGASLYLAAQALKRKGAKEVIVAVPVSSKEGVELLKRAANEIVVLEVPSNFVAVGQFYQDFHQLNDEEVVELLKNSTQI